MYMQLFDGVSNFFFGKSTIGIHVLVIQDIFDKIHKHQDIFSIKSDHILLYCGKLTCK